MPNGVLKPSLSWPIGSVTWGLWSVGSVLLAAGALVSPVVALLGSSMLLGGSVLTVLTSSGLSFHWQVFALFAAHLLCWVMRDPPLDRRKKHA